LEDAIENFMNEKVTIKFSQSAFKHNFTKEDILKAFINVVYDDILDEFENKHLLIGFDGKGRLLEISYNNISDDTIRVFHAMKCRNSFVNLVKK